MQQAREAWMMEKDTYDFHFKEKVRELEEFKGAYFEHEPDAVREYLSMVLENSAYNIEWGRGLQVAYSSGSREVVASA